MKRSDIDKIIAARHKNIAEGWDLFFTKIDGINLNHVHGPSSWRYVSSVTGKCECGAQAPQKVLDIARLVGANTEANDWDE